MPVIITCSAIRIGRAFRNFSQRELAQRAGLTPHRLWQIENNVGVVREDELGRILNVLATDNASDRKPPRGGHAR